MGNLNQALAVLDKNKNRNLTSEPLDIDKLPLNKTIRGRHSSTSSVKFRSHSADRPRSGIQNDTTNSNRPKQWVSVVDRISGKPRGDGVSMDLNVQHLEAAANSKVSRLKTKERIRSALTSPPNSVRCNKLPSKTKEPTQMPQLDCASLYNLYENLQKEHLMVSKLNLQGSEVDKRPKSDKSSSQGESLSGNFLRKTFGSSKNLHQQQSYPRINMSPRSQGYGQERPLKSHGSSFDDKLFIKHSRKSFDISNACDCGMPAENSETTDVSEEIIDDSCILDSENSYDSDFESKQIDLIQKENFESQVPHISVHIQNVTSHSVPEKKPLVETTLNVESETDEPGAHMSDNIYAKPAAVPASSCHEDDRIHFYGDDILTYYNNEQNNFQDHQPAKASLRNRSKSAPPRNRNKSLKLNPHLPSTQAPPPSPSGSFTDLDKIGTSVLDSQVKVPNQYASQSLAPSTLDGVYVNLSYVKIHSPLLVPPPREDADSRIRRPISANMKRPHVVKEIPQTLNHNCVVYTGGTAVTKAAETKHSTVDTRLQLIGKSCVKGLI